MLVLNYPLILLLLLFIIWSKQKIFIHGIDKFKENNMPTIIWWTNLLYPHLDKVNEIECSKGRCVSTTKRTFRNKPNYIAFMFYGTDFDIEKLPLPRKSNHVWALLHEESPMNNFLFSHLTGIQNFNYTSTFSRASDFPLTTQFLPSLEYLTERKPVPTKKKNMYRKKGTAPILYMQSHCNVASDRDHYVKELMKFMQIDSYGKCLNNKEILDKFSSTETYESEDFLDFISKYKFHIAFENAICDDYITEKLFRPLCVGSVPVYMGSASVKDWAPSNKSIIEVKDFEEPSELAAFIKKLDENDQLYEEYLAFKKLGITNSFLRKEIEQRQWGVNDPDKIDFIRAYECYICDEMMSLASSGSVSSPKIANKKHMNCHQPHRSLNVENKVDLTDEWWQEEWVELYWFAYDQAKALQSMIRNNEKNSANYYHYLQETKFKY